MEEYLLAAGVVSAMLAINCILPNSITVLLNLLNNCWYVQAFAFVSVSDTILKCKMYMHRFHYLLCELAVSLTRVVTRLKSCFVSAPASCNLLCLCRCKVETERSINSSAFVTLVSVRALANVQQIDHDSLYPT